MADEERELLRGWRFPPVVESSTVDEPEEVDFSDFDDLLASVKGELREQFEEVFDREVDDFMTEEEWVSLEEDILRFRPHGEIRDVNMFRPSVRVSEPAPVLDESVRVSPEGMFLLKLVDKEKYEAEAVDLFVRYMMEERNDVSIDEIGKLLCHFPQFMMVLVDVLRNSVSSVGCNGRDLYNPFDRRFGYSRVRNTSLARSFMKRSTGLREEMIEKCLNLIDFLLPEDSEAVLEFGSGDNAKFERTLWNLSKALVLP